MAIELAPVAEALTAIAVAFLPMEEAFVPRASELVSCAND